jgi:exonuclease III
MQETHFTPGDLKTLKNEWKGEIYCSYGTSQSRGVATLIPDNIVHNVEQITQDKEGRYILLQGTFMGTKMCILNVYAPTSDKVVDQAKLLDNISPIIEQHCDSIIIGGDLNTCLDQLDKYGTYKGETSFAKRLKLIMDDTNLVDIWRILNPETRRYTWRMCKNNKLQQSRLDYFLISGNLMYGVEECEIKNSLYSDHNPIQLRLTCPNVSPKGRGLWKLNVSLLKDKEYVKGINALLSKKIIQYNKFEDKGLVWDLVKMDIRSHTISYATFKAKQTREYEKLLQDELKDIEQDLADNPTDDTKAQYHTNIKELEKINNEKTRGSQIRARATHIQYNEKNSTYFFQKEISNAKIKNITSLTLEDGTKVKDPTEILQKQKEYYDNLYTQPRCHNLQNRNDAEQEFLQHDNLTKISNEDKNTLEDDLTNAEIANAVLALPNGRSPGADGISIEFYKFFWKQIKDLVIQSINHAIETGNMSNDQKRGVLSLIPKRDKDINLLKNWRPITLLNADYKIYAKAMASKLQQVLPTIISHDQGGCMKGRSTYTNIRSAIDIINYVNEKQLHGILTYIDFEKAFDTVSWNFMYKVLNALNFGEKFIKNIKTMYNGITSCVMNNGHTSSYFKPTRGIRQGCPISANIFIIIVETIAHAIRVNPNVKGIKIGHMEFKISQYADDTCLYLSNQNSLKTVLQIFKKFTTCSGLKVNMEKSEAIWIGASSNFKHKPLGLKWTVGAKYLGIYITNNIRQINEHNFKDKINTIKEMVNMWSLRKLTLKGKIQVINTMILPQILYPATVLHMPELYIEEYNKLIKKFIWNGKPPKIKYTALVNEIENGGLKLQDLKCKIDSLKIKWIKQVADPNVVNPWKSYLSTKFKNSIEEIPYYNLNINDYPPLEGFYHDIFKTWAEIHYKRPTNPEEICRQMIWRNSNIKIDSKTVNYKTWIDHNILHIQDIIDKLGNILTKEQLLNKYSLTCKLLDYESLIAAIPKVWKNSLKTNCGLNHNYLVFKQCNIEIDHINYKLEDINTNQVYWRLLSSLSLRPTSEEKWKEKLNFTIDENMWKLIYTNDKYVTEDNHIRNFQFKITHRLLACNYNLNIYKIRTDNICDYCQEVDTIEHFLVDCNNTDSFWRQVFNWWAACFEVRFQVETYELIFGIPNEFNEHLVNQINFIILYGKYYIYRNKKNNKALDLYEFLLDCKNQMEIKQEIMFGNGEYEKFETKWGELNEYLT